MNPNRLFLAAEWAVAYAVDRVRLRSHLAEVERQDGRRGMLDVIGVAFLLAWRASNWKARKELKIEAKRNGLKLPPSDVGAAPCGAGGVGPEVSPGAEAEPCGVVTRERISATATGGDVESFPVEGVTGSDKGPDSRADRRPAVGDSGSRGDLGAPSTNTKGRR